MRLVGLKGSSVTSTTIRFFGQKQKNVVSNDDNKLLSSEFTSREPYQPGSLAEKHPLSALTFMYISRFMRHVRLDTKPSIVPNSMFMLDGQNEEF